MNEEITIVAVVRDSYDFDKEGKHYTGTSHKVVLAYFHGGTEIPFRCEIVKTTQEAFEKARASVGKRLRGSVLYDRFGKFAGIG